MKFPSYFPPLFHPPAYQGKKAPKKYFEGWYNKFVDDSGKQIWSLIPGVSYSDDPHAFIQIINGMDGKTDYIRFPHEEFMSSRRNYETLIGPNRFSENGMTVNVRSDHFEIKGKLNYPETTPFPQRLIAPGIMGWYTYAPFMECYHGVVSMHHPLEGILEINGSKVDFKGGKGYIEKDWGRSMPTDWVWTQCNHFEGDTGASLMISVARIPWRRSFFPGFLSFFRLNGKVYQFATYNGSKIERLKIQPDALHITLSGNKHKLQVYLQRHKTGELKAPKDGEMSRKIHESLDASMDVQLKEKSGAMLYQGTGVHAGLEIVGDVAQYL